MGCTVAMALLALCPYSLANEPVSPLAQGGDRRSPSMAYVDQFAGGPAYEPAVVVPRRALAERRGRIVVRPRG